MPEFSGSCLCGAVSYTGSTEQIRAMNCHCTDCQKATGAAYATNLFIPESDIKITGAVSTYNHKSDRGSDMVKHSCVACGSPVYGSNSARAGVITVRAGSIDQKDLVVPGGTVFTSSKIPSTPLDPGLKAFEKMPG